MTSFLESCHPRGFSGYILPSSSPKVSVGDLSLCKETTTTNNKFPNPARRQTLRDNEKNNKTRFRFSLHCYPKGPISGLGLLALSFYKTPVLYC